MSVCDYCSREIEDDDEEQGGDCECGAHLCVDCLDPDLHECEAREDDEF